MKRLSSFVFTGVIAAEAGGWLFILSLWYFYTAGISGLYGVVVYTLVLAAVGAVFGLAAWAIRKLLRRS